MGALVCIPAVVVLVTGCAQAQTRSQVIPFPAPPTDVPATEPNTLESVTEQALADAARRAGLPRTQLSVIEAAAVTWSDGSLGCPEEGMSYTQALVPGFRVRIAADSAILDYHAGRSGGALLCPSDRAMPPMAVDVD